MLMIKKTIIYGLFGLIGIVNCTPDAYAVPKIIFCFLATCAICILSLLKEEAPKSKYENDVFKRTVEATLRIASELGFSPQVSSNQLGNGTAIFHIDPDHNFVHLFDMEIPADNASDAEIQQVIEENREKLTDLAKSIKNNKEKK